MRLKEFLTSVVAVVVGVTGCSSSPEQPGESVVEPSIGPIPVLQPGDPVTLPLDAYQLTFDELVTLAKAEARLVKSCAARFGVTFVESEEEMLQGAAGLHLFDSRKRRHAFRYGTYDDDIAAVHGYRVPDNPLLGQPVPPREWTDFEYIVLTGLEDGPQQPVLAGDDEGGTPPPGEYPDVPRPRDSAGEELPHGGCVGEAQRVLMGTGELFSPYYVSNIQSWAFFDAEEDSRVREVTRRFCECMARRGYKVEEPDQGRPEWRDTGHEKPPSAEEVAMAQADVACKQEVNYVGVRMAVESAYQQPVIEKYHDDLERNLRNARTMLENANKVPR